MASYLEPARSRRGAPLAIAGLGAIALVAGVAIGATATVGAAVVFLFACALALWQSQTQAFTWTNALALLVVIVWAIPIRFYTLPGNLPFNLEIYRLLILLFLAAWLFAAVIGRGRLEAAGHGRPAFLLAVAPIASLVFDSHDLARYGVTTDAIKAVSYFLTYVIVFTLICSTIRTARQVDVLVMTIVIGGAIVACFGLVEYRTHYNVFQHLQRVMPFLEYSGKEGAKLRGGSVRVRASAQHPIAYGGAMLMCVPLAVYLARRALTKARSRMWLVLGVLCAMGAMISGSRTVFAMGVAMVACAVWVRKTYMKRLWPLLLVLPIAFHFAAPGAQKSMLRTFSKTDSELTRRAGQGGSGRLADLKPGLHVWKDRPIFGIGLGVSLQDTNVPDRYRLVPQSDADAAHELVFDDQYMTSLVFMGLLGLVGVVWFVLGAVWKLGATARRYVGVRSDLVAACAVSTAGFAVSLATFDAFAFVQDTLLFFIIAALGLTVHRTLRRA